MQLQQLDRARNPYAAAAHEEVVLNFDVQGRHLVSFDETSVNNRTALKRRGWSKKGLRAESKGVVTTPGVHRSVLAALTLSGGFNTAHALIVEGPCGHEVVTRWVKEAVRRGLVGRFPEDDNSAFLMDNWAGHNLDEIRQEVESVGGLLLCNAPKFWEYQPCEPGFNVFKAALRRGGQEAYLADPYAAIGAALDCVTPAIAAGLIRGCKIYPMPAVGAAASAAGMLGAVEQEELAVEQAVGG